MSDRKPLTYEEAAALLPDGDEIHTVRNSAPGLLLGADWPRAKVLEALKAHQPERSGPVATRDGHGIFLEDAHGRLFIATKEQTP